METAAGRSPVENSAPESPDATEPGAGVPQPSGLSGSEDAAALNLPANGSPIPENSSSARGTADGASLFGEDAGTEKAAAHELAADGFTVSEGLFAEDSPAPNQPTAPADSPAVPENSTAPAGSPAVPVNSPTAPAGSPVVPVNSSTAPAGSPATRRPDRVMTDGRRAVVVDYKFGMKEPDRYRRQIRAYCGLLRQMGYTEIEGYLWYVRLGTVERVV